MKIIERDILSRIKAGFKNNRIIIIVGSRQVGKTTVMNLYLDLLDKKVRTVYYNLEDLEHLRACRNIDTLRDDLSTKGMPLNSKSRMFIGIDEFQYIKNATKLLKIIYDLYPHVSVLATGSSSIEIQRHLKESLAGRKKVYLMYPLGMDEYIHLHSAIDYDTYCACAATKFQPDTIELFNNKYIMPYLLYGGYPKVARLRERRDKIEELRDIYLSYIEKDVRSLLRGEEIASFNALIAVLAAQVGSLVNINELCGTLGVERRSIQKYLSVLEETFAIKLVRPYHSNKRAEITKMPKVYFTDPGIINTSLRHYTDPGTRENVGHLIENYVFGEILKHKPVTYELYFWRTKVGTEVDFVLDGGGQCIPLEVKWRDLESPRVPKNMASFMQLRNDIKEAVIVTRDYSGSLIYEGKTIYFIPAVVIGKYISGLKD